MIRAACLVLALLPLWCLPVNAACRQALALGLDVSGSVDSSEYDLQRNGLAAALLDPEVERAFLATPGTPVRLVVFEWSGSAYQRLFIDWTEIRARSDLIRIAGQLTKTSRGAHPPETGLGAAMMYGASLLSMHTDCWRRVLDLSGDGKHNSGPHPRAVRKELAETGLTINALVIGAEAGHDADLAQIEIAELTAYFRAWVLLGPDAFIETALGFEDFERAMTRKLLRELQTLAVSDLRRPSDLR